MNFRSRKKLWTIPFFLIVFLSSYGVGSGAVFCVSDSTRLQAALTTAQANEENDVIQIEQGTYTGNFIFDSNESFDLSIQGGFAVGCGSRVLDATNTILDARGTGTVLGIQSTGNGLAIIIEGITIQNGAFSGLRVSALNGTLNLSHSTLKNNIYLTLQGEGGGAFVWTHEARIIRNLFNENYAQSGGGIRIVSVIAYLENNTVVSNRAGYGGGVVIANVSAETVSFIGNIISGNQADYAEGGGIEIGAGNATVNFRNNLIINNATTRNIGGGHGGGAHIFGYGVLNFINNTVVDNSSTLANGCGGGITVYHASQANIINNIFWSNVGITGHDVCFYDIGQANVSLLYNDIDQNPGGISGIDNFVFDLSNLNHLDPLFADSANANYRLQLGSPCIDSGDNSAPSLPLTDIEGNNRIIGAKIDMGAYEYPDTITPTVEITSPTSGLNYSTSQATINLEGNASDNVGVTGVTWANDRGGGGNCSGTTSWSCGGIALLVGQNVITVTASDEAGNPGTDTLTVTYTPPVAAPDFLVDSISITPTFLLPNSTFNATVTIKNQGVGSADAGFLDIWKNRDVTAGCGTSGDIRVSVGILAAGETRAFSFFNLSTGPEGNRTFRAFVDSTCSASESNEGNNQRTSPYQVKAACSYSLTPPIWAFGASGGIGSFFVATREECSWVPVSDSDWLMCQEGRVGPGILYYSVVPNDAGTAREGNISVQGQNFSILQAKSDFVDVDSDYWANSWIYAVYASELSSGYGNGYFGPEDYVTREQMAVLIIRALNEVPDDGYCGLTNSFSDVGFDRWSCKYIKKLSELGITTGYGDGRFGPEDIVTREQMAVFILRARAAVPPDGYCEGTDPFTDVPFKRWSCKYVKKLAELEITTGYGDGRFGPTDYVTRAQMAVFLSRGFLGM